MDISFKNKRQVTILKSVLRLVSVVLLVFAVYNFFVASWVSMYVEISMLLFNLFVLCNFKKLITKETFAVFNLLFTHILFLFLMYLININDFHSSSHFWIIAIPLCAYMLTGHKTGFKLTAFYLLLCLFIFSTKYNIDPFYVSFKDILNVAFLIVFVWFLSYFYESSTEQQQDKLLELAHKDKLTKLYNRHAFYNFFEQHNSQKMCLLVLDLDWFKKINDSYGHDAGDYVLVEVARNLITNTPVGCKVFRLGGEEFGVLMPNTDQKFAVETAHLLLKSIKNQEVIYTDTKRNVECLIPVTASIGIACQEKINLDLLQLMKKADHNLYLAKDKGRNCVVYD